MKEISCLGGEGAENQWVEELNQWSKLGGEGKMTAMLPYNKGTNTRCLGGSGKVDRGAEKGKKSGRRLGGR